MIRKSAAILFGVVFLLVGAAYYLINDSLVESWTEDLLSDLFLADARVDGMDLDPLEMSAAVKGIQIQDADKPWTNLIETKNATLDVVGMQLFAGNLAIREMRLEGLTFAKNRQGEGPEDYVNYKKRVRPEDPEEEGPGFFEDLQKQLPPVNLDALGKELNIDQHAGSENLESVRFYNQAKEAAALRQASLQQRVDQFQEAAEVLEKDMKAFQGKNFKTPQEIQNGVNELKSLGERSKKLQQESKEIQAQAKSDYALVKTDMAKVQELSNQDINRIKDLLHLNGMNSDQIGRALFGPEVVDQIKTMMQYLEMAKAFASTPEEDKPRPRKAGINVTFPRTSRVYPGLMVDLLKFSGAATSSQGEVISEMQGEVVGISSNPNIYGKPVTLKMNMINHLKGDQYLITGSLDHVGEHAKDEISIRGQNLKLDEIKLGSAGKSMPYKMVSQDATLEVDIVLDKGQLNSRLNLRANQMRFVFPEDAPTQGESAKAARAIFADLDHVNLTATLTGDHQKMVFKLDSDLDNKLQQRFNQVVGNRTKAEEAKIRAKVESKYKAGMDQWAAKEAETKQKLDQKTTQLANQIEQQKNQLETQWNQKEQEVQQRLKDEEAKAKAQAQQKLQQEQDKAKAQAEQKAKQEQDKAKSQLQNQLQNKIKLP